MIKIFIEAQKKETSEYQFLKALLSSNLHIDESEYKIEPVNGKDNLKNNDNNFNINTLEGGKNIIIFDADNPDNGGGFEKRRTELLKVIAEMGVESELFLFPNNHDDGMFENLLENLMLKDKYKSFFDCFNDYENCLGNDYVHPNLKARVFTYISSMKALPNKVRKRLGSGNWQFSNMDYWNLDSPALKP